MPLPIKEENLKYIMKKVNALYARHGFDGISMEEISRQTNISKSTLYRYFTSKEDIVKGMTGLLIAHLDSIQFTETENIQDVMDNILKFYRKTIVVTALSGFSFLRDLGHKFPDAYEAYRTSMNALKFRFSEFYDTAVKKSFFKDILFGLVYRQFSNMLPVIIDMNYLEQNGLTLRGSLQEYYRIFLCQILTEKYNSVIGRKETYDFTAELAEDLENDFFISSIRQ